MLEIDKLYKLIKKILSLKIPASLTINFDGTGGFKKEIKLGETAVERIFREEFHN